METLLMLLLMLVSIYGLRKESVIWVSTLGSHVREIWKKSKERNKELLENVSAKSGYFRLKSHGVGKYGRVLGEIFIMDDEGKQYNVNETLVSEGHGYEYFGGKKKLMTETKKKDK